MENEVEEWVVGAYYGRSEHYYYFRVPAAELDTFCDRLAARKDVDPDNISVHPLNPPEDMGTGLELG